jgi:transcriptional regulator with XRE-family HTH domain
MPDELETIGARVRWARMRAALSQTELSGATGIPEATISRIESGKNAQPRFATIRKLADVLDIDAGWLLVGDNGDASKNAA